MGEKDKETGDVKKLAEDQGMSEADFYRFVICNNITGISNVKFLRIIVNVVLLYSFWEHDV